MRFFRDVSLIVKLLGLYFAGLIILGIIGYGFFIKLEVDGYRNDEQAFRKQADALVELSSEHLKYTLDLRAILSSILEKDGGQKKQSTDVVKQFGNMVSSLNTQAFFFAMLDENGDLVAGNNESFTRQYRAASGVKSEVFPLIRVASEKGSTGFRFELKADSVRKPYYAHAVYFPSIRYYILSVANHQEVDAQLARVLERKREQIRWSIMQGFAVGVVMSVVVLLIFFIYLRLITRHIKSVTKRIDALSKSELAETQLISKNRDEIGKMIAAVNAYLGKKIALEKFKQLIEEDEGIEDVYCRIFTLLDSLGLKKFALYEINPTGNRIEHVESLSCGIQAEGGWGFPCSPEITVNADACRARRLAQIVHGDDAQRTCPKYARYSQGCSYYCIPIIIAGQPGEILHVSVPKGQTEESATAIQELTQYLKNAAPVIESKKLLASLRETTLRDALTGLRNRRFLEEYVQVLSAEVRRTKTMAGILMCDLDYFKKVNDELGHEAGDKVLRLLSSIIESSVRESDIVVRYGGEEFLILIKNATDEDSVVQVAEKIRRAVESHEMHIAPGVMLKKTLSIGVSIFPKDTENFWQCVKYADVSLYRAKESGRNKVIRFESSMWQIEDY